MAWTATLCGRNELSSDTWLSVQKMLAYDRHHRSTAFPPPELPGFIGTMQPSDFPYVICKPLFFRLVMHTRPFDI